MKLAVAMAIVPHTNDYPMICQVVGVTASLKKAQEMQMQKLYATLDDFVASQEDSLWEWETPGSPYSSILYNDNYTKGVISITILQ